MNGVEKYVNETTETTTHSLAIEKTNACVVPPLIKPTCEAVAMTLVGTSQRDYPAKSTGTSFPGCEAAAMTLLEHRLRTSPREYQCHLEHSESFCVPSTPSMSHEGVKCNQFRTNNCEAEPAVKQYMQTEIVLHRQQFSSARWLHSDPRGSWRPYTVNSGKVYSTTGARSVHRRRWNMYITRALALRNLFLLANVLHDGRKCAVMHSTNWMRA